MYKYKKILLNSICLLFIIIHIIEFVIYLFNNSNIYGIYYLIINLLILFLLLPVTYNYKRYFSKARISKLIIIIIFGIFNSFFLEMIVFNNINYIDSSYNYINNILIFKNIIKPIIYFVILIFILLETKAYLLLKRKYLQKSKKS